MKKKRNILFGVIAVIIGLCFAGMMGSDESTPKSTPTVKEEAPREPSTDEIKVADIATEPEPLPESVKEVQGRAEDEPASSSSNIDYFEIGETFSNQEDLSITALDIGIRDSEYAIKYMYVTTEIENISDDVQYIIQDTTVYVDDYQEEPVMVTDRETLLNMDTDIDLNPGRKCEFTFITGISDSAYNGNKVEFEIFDGVIVKFKDNGVWLYGDDSGGQTNTSTSVSSVSGGIGNPIIDADPDRYIPEGITGEIDVIDGTFYTDSAIGFTPGEYLIVGGGNTVVTISEDHKFSLSFLNGDVDFKDADMEELINCDEACSYQVYGNDTGYVVSFFNNGLYLYTDHADDENDWAEGFYEILN